MSYIKLKDLMDNIGGQIKLTLKSKGSYRVVEFDGRKSNRFDYEVLKDNEPMVLSATDALHKKVNDLSVNDDFMLSFERFTNNENQVIKYWKVEKVEGDSPKSVNQFDEMLKRDKAVNKAVDQTKTTYTNGARFGMIFNNCVKLYIANEMVWTKEQFAEEFRRVENWVELCENKPNTPKPNNEAKMYEKRVVEMYPDEPTEIPEDELPF